MYPNLEDCIWDRMQKDKNSSYRPNRISLVIISQYFKVKTNAYRKPQ